MEATAPTILEIGVVLLAAAAAGWIARRIGLPAVVGYLVVGLAISPFTPGYVADREQIQLLADVGVVLLLFEVGIEVDVARLRREQRGLLIAGPLQLVFTAAVSGVVFVAIGIPLVGAALAGLAIALSSSVVVVNIVRSRRRTTDRATEQAMLGWSVIQDLTGVACAAGVLAVGGLAARAPAEALAGFLVYGIIVVAVARMLPRVLRRIRAEHDLFLIVSIAGGLALAGVGSVAFGLPLALAAFVAGLAIGEDPDAAEARRRLLPFRDVFAVLFFVAIGTLIDPAALGAALPVLGLVLVLLVAAKVGPIYVLARLLRLPARPAQLAIGLGQVGEFSFVLATTALATGVIAHDLYAAILGAVAISVAGSTILVRRIGAPAAAAA